MCVVNIEVEGRIELKTQTLRGPSFLKQYITNVKNKGKIDQNIFKKSYQKL